MLSDEELSKAAAITPRTFDAPLARTREGLSPGEQLLPTGRRRGSPPGAKDGASIIKGKRLMDSLVSIDANRDHIDLP